VESNCLIDTITDEYLQASEVVSRKVDKQDRSQYSEVYACVYRRLPWSKEKDLELVKSVIKIGKHWTELPRLFGFQQNENFLKNRFNLILRKEKYKS
jgi:hypothetical protein